MFLRDGAKCIENTYFCLYATEHEVGQGHPRPSNDTGVVEIMS